MATGTISSAGLGSGLDVSSLVSSLMAIEKRPITLLQTKQSDYKSQISAIGTIKSALASLQTAAQAFATDSSVLSVKGTVADSAIASATVTTSAVPSSYSLEVNALAASQKLVSSSLASSSTSLGTGTGSIQIDFGSVDSGGAFVANSARASVSIAVPSTSMTLAGVRDAINAANKGVSASIVTDASGARLVITNDQSGAQQVMRVSVSDPDGNNTDTAGLSMLAYDPATTGGAIKNMTQSVAAADASIKLDGMTITASSNTLTNVVDGISLTLTKTNTGSPTTLAVSSDDTTLTKTINAFITAYNTVNTTLRSASKYDADTKTAAIFQGDITIRSIQTQLRSAVATAFGSGAYSRLADIGITQQTDGSLKMDSTKFQAAFKANRTAVTDLFTKDASGTTGKGAGGTFDTLLKSIIGTDGSLTNKTTSLNKRVDSIDDQITAMEARLEKVQERYQRQFSALDTTVSNGQSMMAYLEQQLASIASISKSSSSK